MYKLIARCVALFYAVCRLFPKRNRITFFSRQGKRGSLDFRMLADAVREKCPQIDVRICATDPENVDKKAFILSMPSMLYHAATSRVCVLEGYIPAISIPKLDSQTRVIQLWHALGAIKKFGYQSIDTPAGRSLDEATALRMHKNYDWIIAAGPGAVSAYAEAFGYSRDAIRPLGMPRMDYLLDNSSASKRLAKASDLRERFSCLGDGVMRVLYVPTLRKGEGAHGWMTREVERLSRAFRPYRCRVIVAGHPLDEGCDSGTLEKLSNVAAIPGVASIDLIASSDCVVTDYSAIAFEAGLAGKPVWFYAPDVEQYRQSPGLNIDPLKEFPDGAFDDPDELASAIGCGKMPRKFTEYIIRYFGDVELGATSKLAEFVEECYLDTFGNGKGKN
ncbi:CDP-glycerol glycerophosphotransferase family protein [Slackia equolifaciens]|uniref:CDP-glycerol glycerophosphotransferase family protein n=1 Tax=Slackia equolifaciens TaxID=498718 RepID=UPI00137941A6